MIDSATITKLQDTALNFVVEYGFKYGLQFIGAVTILCLGGAAALWAGQGVGRWLTKRSFEPPVRMLATRVVRLLIFAVAAVMALGKFGVDIAPLIAGIGVAGVGIGLAMQGVLGNLVAGLTIIFTKPFRVGEFIELLGVHGEVVSIELFSTVLVHTDRSRVTIPNRKIVGEILHNHGRIRQLKLEVDVAYSADLAQALALVDCILKANPRVLRDPAPVVGINALEASSINLSVQPWVAVPDYEAAQLEIYRTLLDVFRQHNIEIPFPQQEVRLLGTPPVDSR
jgi:small conductance mechanosensitive channel